MSFSCGSLVLDIGARFKSDGVTYIQPAALLPNQKRAYSIALDNVLDLLYLG